MSFLLFEFGKILYKISARDIIEDFEFREHRPGQAIIFLTSVYEIMKVTNKMQLYRLIYYS
jgi:hypothetical protein